MKKSLIIKYIVSILIIFCAVYTFLYLRYYKKSFILVYHRIEPYQGGLKSLYVTPQTFSRQMKFLYSRKYKSVTLDELRDMIINKNIHPKTFCITFDDGYKSNYDYAYPILKKYGFVATVFVNVSAIGKKVGYSQMPEAEHMSVTQLKQISDIFKIGSHSVTHREMDKLTQEEIKIELIESRKILEDILKTTNVRQQVVHFCYPFGKLFNNYNLLLSSCGYITGCSTLSGLVTENSDVYCLPRVEWKELSSMSFKDVIKNIDFYIKIFLGI